MAAYITVLLALGIVRALLHFINDVENDNGVGECVSIIMVLCYILGIVFLWNL